MLGLFKRKRVDPRDELCAVLGGSELPSFPAVITAALEKVRDVDASVASIADVIVADPGLSVRVLGTVNSAAFALRHQVKSIHHAVSLMGRGQLESLLISMAMREALPREAAPGFQAKRFWTTAARRATTGRALAELIDPASRSESFTACLLQDLAVPILAQRKRPEYGAILEQWHGGTDCLARLEQDAFGWDHAGIGERLSREWEFPEHLSRAIGTHHDGGDGGGEPLPAARLVANLREVEPEKSVERLIDTVHDRYGLAKNRVADLAAASFEAASEIARMFT